MFDRPRGAGTTEQTDAAFTPSPFAEGRWRCRNQPYKGARFGEDGFRGARRAFPWEPSKWVRMRLELVTFRRRVPPSATEDSNPASNETTSREPREGADHCGALAAITRSPSRLRIAIPATPSARAPSPASTS